MPGDDRKHTYYQLATHFAGLSDAAIRNLWDAPSAVRWGLHHTIEVGRTRVFVKRLPVTDRELDNRYSTRNLYQLPTYYNYGVGSAGFGAFREILGHVATTHWVLDGATDQFPLLYHHRIIPVVGRPPGAMEPDEQERYVSAWNGSKRIERYLRDRAAARHEAVLFIEHLPHGLMDWLERRMDRVDWALGEMRRAVVFLRDRGMVHFDAHYGNLLTDGERVYVSDFGLLLDRRFDLRPREEDFLRAHRHYDEATVITNVCAHLVVQFLELSEPARHDLLARYGAERAAERGDVAAVRRCLFDNVEDIAARGPLRLTPHYAATVTRYRPIITMMNDFYVALRRDRRKRVRFDGKRFARLLRAVT